jgi:hypothetical protein
VAYYPFNGNANDESGNGNHGIINGDIQFESGRLDLAARFKDRTTYISVTSDKLNFNGWTALTLAAWVQMSDYTTYGTIIEQSTVNSEWATELRIGGDWAEEYYEGHFAIQTDSATGEYIIPPTLQTGVYPWPLLEYWYHLVGVFDGEFLRYYVNGILDSIQPISTQNQGKPIWVGQNSETRIGMSVAYPEWNDMHLDGLIDEVRVYNRALLDEEIQAIYNVYQGIDEKELINMSVYPNPFKGETRFYIRLDEPTQVNLVVMDRLGKLIATVLEASLSQGEHQITWNANCLPSGIYFYRLTADSQNSTGKLLVVR